MSMTKFLDPKNDVVFKKIFGEEASKGHLISFLNSVLTLKDDQEIKELAFLNPYQAPRIAGKKMSFIDVLVTDQRNIRYVIEMQIVRVSAFEKRVQYYAAKTYVAQNESGADYPKLNQVYFLGIADHSLFQTLYKRGLRLVTGIGKNMKNYLMNIKEKTFLRKRFISDTVFDYLKNKFQIQHTRHRSPTNAVLHIISTLVAYQQKNIKPEINSI